MNALTAHDGGLVNGHRLTIDLHKPNHAIILLLENARVGISIASSDRKKLVALNDDGVG